MEIWKPLKNFPSYNGSTEGRIMNIRTQRIMRTYTNSKGEVKENEKVDTGTDTYTIFEFDGWNGRATPPSVKQVTDFENKLIGDVALKRYEVSGQCRTKFTPSRANAVTRKFNKVISVGNESGTTLLPAPSGQ